MNKSIQLGLIRSRHEMPVSEFIFNDELDPMDFDKMFSTAYKVIDALYYDSGIREIHLFVTGLTAAFAAVVTVCSFKKISLIAYHFNRETGEYHPQRVLDRG